MSWGDNAAQKTRQPKETLVEKMQRSLFEEPLVLPEQIPTCAMFYGEDGTGKTGLALATLTEEDVLAGKKIVVVDLDSGNLPLIMEHHKDKINAKALSYKNPMVWGNDKNGTPALDYKQTMANINAIAIAAKNQWDIDQSVKGIVLDGGSKFLKYAENQMRLEKAITPDGGVSTRYWLVRNKMFLEALELYKSLPFDKYFIFHEDFIPNSQSDNKISSVKLQTNQMMFQKVLCERRDSGPTVEYRATIDKSKFDITKEGRQIVFGVVNKKEQSYSWEPEKVLRELRKENESAYSVTDKEEKKVKRNKDVEE